jgi:hypothetical protein
MDDVQTINNCILDVMYTKVFGEIEVLTAMIEVSKTSIVVRYPQTVTSCHDLGGCVTYRRLLDWMIEFIDTLYIQLGTTGNYSATAIPTLYSSPLHSH